eukprot:gene43317-52948_t
MDPPAETTTVSEPQQVDLVTPAKESLKRSVDAVAVDVPEHAPVSRPRLGNGPAHTPKAESKKDNGKNMMINRGAKFASNEVYVNLVSELMYPKHVAAFDANSLDKSKFSFDRVTALGYLTSPLRPVNVMGKHVKLFSTDYKPMGLIYDIRLSAERWSPYEIAVFEAAIALYGKNFHTIQTYVKTKTTQEVIALYYDWKKTSHYAQWKQAYLVDERDFE